MTPRPYRFPRFLLALAGLVLVAAPLLQNADAQQPPAPRLRICTGCAAAGNMGPELQTILQQAQGLAQGGRLQIDSFPRAGESARNPAVFFGTGNPLQAYRGNAASLAALQNQLTALAAQPAPPAQPQTRGLYVIKQDGSGLTPRPGFPYFDKLVELFRGTGPDAEQTREIFGFPRGRPLRLGAELAAETILHNIRTARPQASGRHVHQERFAQWLVAFGGRLFIGDPRINPALSLLPGLSGGIIQPPPIPFGLSLDDLARIESRPERILFTPSNTGGIEIPPSLYFFDARVPIGDRRIGDRDVPLVAIAREQGNRIELLPASQATQQLPQPAPGIPTPPPRGFILPPFIPGSQPTIPGQLTPQQAALLAQQQSQQAAQQAAQQRAQQQAQQQARSLQDLQQQLALENLLQNLFRQRQQEQPQQQPQGGGGGGQPSGGGGQPAVAQPQQPVGGTPEGVVCAQIEDPVCGTDGRTYSNACVAERQFRVPVARRGPCQPGEAGDRAARTPTSPDEQQLVFSPEERDALARAKAEGRLNIESFGNFLRGVFARNQSVLASFVAGLVNLLTQALTFGGITAEDLLQHQRRR